MSAVILHIGMPKTGTSSLQRSLSGFADDRFVWYADHKGRTNHTAEMFNIVGLPAPTQADRARNDQTTTEQLSARTQLEKTLGSLAGRTLIISGEGIPRMPAPQLRKLAAYLRQQGVKKITVFAYIRPPGSFVTSLARAKMGGRLDNFALEQRATHYRTQFEKFDEVFGHDNVVLRKFDPGRFPKGDTVQDFCAQFGIDFPASGTIRVNESLSREAVALFYLYRKYGPDDAADLRGPRRLRLVNELGKIGSRKFQLAPELMRQFVAANREDIGWMEARLGDSLSEEFGERQAGDVSSEAELLELASAGVDDLLKLLGKHAPPDVDRSAPEEIAGLVAKLAGPGGARASRNPPAARRAAARGSARIPLGRRRAGARQPRAVWKRGNASFATSIDLQTFPSGTTGTQKFLFYPELPKEPWCKPFPLPVETFINALITPIQRADVAKAGQQFTGGVFDADGRLIPHADRQIVRGKLPINTERAKVADAKRLAGRSYFAGILFPNFGHALIETPSRLWALFDLDSRPDRILFQAWTKKGVEDIFQRPFARFIFDALGIRQSQCEIVEQPTRCEQLIVPASTIAINDHSHPRFIEIYDRILATKSFEGSAIKRVYLSRRGLTGERRKAVNEEDIERLFAARAFTVIRPETLPFEEQVRIMQGAEIIAGTDGSAMHMTAFARPSATVFAVDCRISPNQYAVEAARGVGAIHVMTTDGRPGRAPWTAKLDRLERAFDLLENGL